MNNLAAAYEAAGLREKALPLYEQALAKRKEKLGPNHPDTLNTMTNLAGAYQIADQLDKALPLFEQALAKQKETLGPDHPDTLNTMTNLASVHLRNADFAQAERLLRPCLSARQQKQPDDWSTFDMQTRLGASLLGQKKYAEAEPLLVGGYEGLKQHADRIPAPHRKVLTQTLDWLVQLYDAWGKPDQAARWRAERDKLLKPPEPPRAK